MIQHVMKSNAVPDQNITSYRLKDYRYNIIQEDLFPVLY
jgi:hypothetical protein